METKLLSQFGIDERYLAHTPNECLKDHLNLTLKYYKKIVQSKNLDHLIDTIINLIDSSNADLIKEMFVNAIYLHDIGKKNPCFQAKKMKNHLFKNIECGDSKHSHNGAIEYIRYYMPKINDIEDGRAYNRLIYILYNFAYHISKHHSKLDNIEKYFQKDSKNHPDFTNVKNDIDSYLDKKFEFYILNKLLFSLLVSSDYYATNEYMANLSIDNFGLFSQSDKKALINKFNTFIAKFKNPKGINKLRNDIFKEAEQNLLQNLDRYIFYLEAPTGSGKTITSINLALKLLKEKDEINKLFYVFPFNTLVEQTKSVFDEIFEDELEIEVINSISPISVDEKHQEDQESKYQKSYINRLFFHSPFIITTHVALFNILFGTGKEENFPLWQLANSVIIIDEIQSYNNHLWWYMVEFFDKYASLLNIKIIIMSATLPKLDYFLKRKDSFVSLIGEKKRKELFENPLFKQRVKIDYSLLEKKMDIESLSKVLEAQPRNKKILFEFITKQSTRAFYNHIKDKFENVYELSGDDNKAYRQYVINKSKNEPLIIVATQVIEAGVDIDMDIGFKDIATIDSEEQFMGRINRNCEKEGLVYFFDMDDAEKIYRNDNRLGLDLKDQKYRDILQNKEFQKYYEEVLKRIKSNGDRFEKGLLTNYEHFENLIKKLNYKEIAKTMTLINSQNLTLFFPFQIDISRYKGVKEFENLDQKFITDGKLDGQKVWDEFVALDEIETIKSYSYKEIAKSQINSLIQFFTFSIFKTDYRQQPPFYTTEYRGYYFVNDLSYITDEGKFDRAAYNAIQNSNFL